MRIPAIVLILLLVSEAAVRAQDVDAESEDMIVLSPFEITSEYEAGYSAASALAGARMSTSLVDPNLASRVPNVPITITRRAEALAVSSSRVNFGDKQERRNAELYTSVESLRSAVEGAPGLRFEHREIRFASGNRSKLAIGRSGATASHAAVLILADLPEDVDVVEKVKLIRDTVQKAALQGQTKIVDGVVGLYLKNPAKYRREILDRIFEDINALKQSLGPEFEVLPSGMNQPVRARVASETDVELWIEYSFTIRSIRELTQPKTLPAR